MVMANLAGVCGTFRSNAVPDWIGAGTAVVALVLAWLAWRAAQGQLTALRTQLGNEQKAIEDAAQAEERSQADRVSAWFTAGGAAVMFQNASNQPVFDVAFAVFVDGAWADVKPQYPARLATVSPRRPTDETDLDIPLTGRQPDQVRNAANSDQPAKLAYTFRDIGQREWSRQSNGKLVLGSKLWA